MLYILCPPPLCVITPRILGGAIVFRDYREGEQAYISYGLKSNDELLQFYGFVEADCPADTYVVVRDQSLVGFGPRVGVVLHSLSTLLSLFQGGWNSPPK